MFALPADAGLCGQRFFHHRRRIDEDFDIAAGSGGKAPGDAFQPALDQIMVIAILGIDGYCGLVPVAQNFERIAVGTIVHPEHQDRLHLRPKHPRITAPLSGLRQPVHGGMVACCNIGVKGGHSLLSYGVRRHHPCNIKSGSQSFGHQKGLERLGFFRRCEIQGCGFRWLHRRRSHRSKIQIRIVRDRRDDADAVAQQRPHAGTRLDALVPGFGTGGLIPFDFAEIIKR